jgi:hypothetical protein
MRRYYTAFSLVMAVLAAGGLSAGNLIAAAAPPAVPPAVTAEAQGDWIVLTFPEGTDPGSVSLRVNRIDFFRGELRHHRDCFKWTGPTELRMRHHKIPNPHEGIWVWGEAKGYVSLHQFVVVGNLPLYH